MKKLLFLLLSIISALPIFAREFDYTYEGSTLIYTVLDEEAHTCEVSNRRGSSPKGCLIIPETASDGNVEYSVISIVDRLCYNDSALTSVTIPNSVTAIGNYVFYGCEYLTSVTMPNSITSIGNYAFAICQRLRSVTIPNSVTSIGDYAFGWCGITTATIPDSVTSVGYRAFIWCEKLTSLTISASLTSISDDAFYGCESLTSVTIPNSVTSIGNYAFSICSGLTSVTIPNTVISIGDYAFARSGLTSVTIPNSVTSINCGTFSECKNLTDVIFPPSIEKIGDSAFNGCIRLESLIMGPNLKEIGNEAFKACKISNLYITTPTPPALPDGLSNFSDSPEGHRTTFFQNEAIRENYQSELWEELWGNYQSELWNKYVFLLEEGGETALMVEWTAFEFGAEGYTSLTGRPGDTFQLSAKLYPEDVTLPYVFWRSTNTEIASVDYDGLVTIHADLSEATPLDEGDGSQVACHIIAETLYSDGPVGEIPVVYNQSTGIPDVVGGESSSDIDPNAPMEVFTIQGTKVSDSIDKLSAGIYIVRQGNKVKKISVQ